MTAAAAIGVMRNARLAEKVLTKSKSCAIMHLKKRDLPSAFFVPFPSVKEL